MKLTAICLGQAEKLPGRSYRSGIGKVPVGGPVMVDTNGLLGDAICNRRHHGGPDQALLLEGALTLGWWEQKLGRSMPPGQFGENLVIEGLDNRDVAVGDRFTIGQVVLEAASARIPCNTLAVRMKDPDFAHVYNAAARPGIYCRVLQGGIFSAGDMVVFEHYGQERIAISALLSGLGSLPDEQKRRYLAAPLGARVRDIVSRGRAER